MRKKSRFILLAAFMAACFCFAGCAGEGEEKSEENPGEYGYLAEDRELNGIEGIITGVSQREGDLYITVRLGEGDLAVYRCPADGGEVHRIELEEERFSRITAMCMNGEGDLVFTAVPRAAEGEASPAEYRLVTASARSGKTKSSVKLPEKEPWQSQPAGMATDREGNVYLNYGGSLGALNSEGEVRFEISSEGAYIMDLMRSGSGDVFAAMAVPDGWAVKPVDAAKQAFWEDFTGIKSLEKGKSFSFEGENESGFFYRVGDKLYAYDEQNGEREILSFLDCDLNASYVKAVLGNGDGGFNVVMCAEKWNDATGEMMAEYERLVSLKPAKPSELPEKKVLTYGVVMGDSETVDTVIEFNRSNPDYHIDVKNYSSGDFMSCIQKMNMDLMTGKGPDIIDLSFPDMTDIYIARGMLEDMTPYLESDPELHREDFVENILDIYGKDKLFVVIPNYYVASVAGKTEDVGDKGNWTLEEMTELAEGRAEVQSLFEPSVSSVQILTDMVVTNMDRFIDWDMGKCFFNQEEFVHMMEFAGKYGAAETAFDPNKAVQANEQIPDNLRSGRQLLQSAFIGNVFSVNMYETIFGAPVTFIGYAADEGCGSRLVPQQALGINASSPDKEGAWQFVRSFLKPGYQDGIKGTYGFPIREDSLNKMYEEAMRPEYEEDENGVQIEKPKMTDYIMGLEIRSCAVKKEQIDMLDALIHKLTRVQKRNTEINNIISEEAASYYSGQKTAGEAAEIIQNRVQMYVDENR